MKKQLELSYVSKTHRERFEKELNRHENASVREKAVMYVMSATENPDIFFNFDFIYPEVLTIEKLENNVSHMDKCLYALGFNLYNGNSDVFGKETTPYTFSILLKENAFVLSQAIELMTAS